MRSRKASYSLYLKFFVLLKRNIDQHLGTCVMVCIAGECDSPLRNPYYQTYYAENNNTYG